MTIAQQRSTVRAEIAALAPSRIRQVANAAMDRDDVLAFWFGESDQPTPDFIRDAAQQSLDRAETFYSQNLGRPALRAAIATYQSRLRGITLEADRVAVTGSGVSAIMLAAQMLLSPGDRAVVLGPIWPNVAEIPRILGALVERFPLTNRSGRWQLDLPRLLATLRPDVRLLVLNSPNNPTGWTISSAEQRAILLHCRRHGIWILSDEVYERLIFEPARGAAPSMLDLATPEDRLIVVNSFSKAWRMTGWQIGWLVVPPDLIPDLEKVIEYNTSCVPVFVQQGAIAALTDPRGEAEVMAQRASLTASRELLRSGLVALPGVELPEAAGAMYAFFRIDGHTNSLALAKALVSEVGLGLAPGIAFGAEGEGWLRWCFAASSDKIAVGLERLGRYLATHSQF